MEEESSEENLMSRHSQGGGSKRAVLEGGSKGALESLHEGKRASPAHEQVKFFEFPAIGPADV